MRVVPAGVHHAGFHAGGRHGHLFRGERKPGLLHHRQAIHIGTQQDQRAFAVAGHGDDPGPAEVQVLAALAWTSLHGTISLLVAQRVDARLDQETLVDRAVEHAMALALPPQS